MLYYEYVSSPSTGLMVKIMLCLQVMPLLSHPNEKIVHEVLAFIEAILQFGNAHVQEGLKELVKSQEHHRAFSALSTILKRASIAFEERYSENYYIFIYKLCGDSIAVNFC